MAQQEGRQRREGRPCEKWRQWRGRSSGQPPPGWGWARCCVLSVAGELTERRGTLDELNERRGTRPALPELLDDFSVRVSFPALKNRTPK
mmetsp:Transcript_26187/g.84565  ORF Transcript_26187/g.84565 Transcript_26187/m.84565 type:complete len:90 (-) Transcript_26187:31-300(-)